MLCCLAEIKHQPAGPSIQTCFGGEHIFAHLCSCRLDRGRVVTVEAGNGCLSQVFGKGLERRGGLGVIQDCNYAGQHSMPQLLHSCWGWPILIPIWP